MNRWMLSAHGMAGKRSHHNGNGHERTWDKRRTLQSMTSAGRWPANLILSYPEDEYDAEGNLLPNPGKDEVLEGFPVTTRGR
jgi:hypothetical protein